MPEPPSRPDDLGLGMWEAGPDVEFPTHEGRVPNRRWVHHGYAAVTLPTAPITWGRSSVGTLMSESVGLGEADAESRWVGIRRHQAALIILGLGLAGDWLVASHAQSGELALGLCFLAAALPVNDGLTAAEFLCVSALFVLRPPWMVVHTESRGRTMVVRARGKTNATGFELLHRGRLDLSGSDFELSERLVDLTKSLATSGEVDHASIHVRSATTSANTLLTLRTSALNPEGWHENPRALTKVPRLATRYAVRRRS